MSTRYLEDFAPGQSYAGGALAVSRDDIVSFARLYDPLPIHLEGDVIASGSHIMALRTRLLHDVMGHNPMILAALGWDAVQFLKPVVAGDVLSIRVEIETVRPSRSRPDRGVVESRISLLNQRDELVFSHRDTILVRRRSS